MRDAHTNMRPLVAKSGSSATPRSPASPIARMPATCALAMRLAFGAVDAKTSMDPGRSVTTIRPSEANAMSHGTVRPDWTTVSVIPGALRVGLGALAHAPRRSDARANPSAPRPPTPDIVHPAVPDSRGAPIALSDP